MEQRVMVTGGAGFIGSEMVRKLLARGYDVVCFDLAEQFSRHQALFDELRTRGKLHLAAGSILDRTALRVAIKGVDVVVHCAAMLGVRKTEEHKLGCLETNITGTDNVLGACVMNDVTKIVFTSSSEVYGEPNHNPIRETDEAKGKTVYAISKLAGEELVKGYNQLYPHLKYTIVRFFNTYGEGQVAQFVLTRFVHQVLAGRNPVVYGHGMQLRSYGHVDDVTEGVVKCIENPISNGKLYNLGNPGQIMTVTELAQKVIDLLAPGRGLKVEVLGSFDGSDRIAEREIHSRYCDTTLAETELGFTATITVEEGIRRIANYGAIHTDWPTI